MAVARSFIYAPTFPGRSLTAPEHGAGLGRVGNGGNPVAIAASKGETVGLPLTNN
jgi:hypothetical protein